jgi:hypothetical protein
MRGLIRWPLLAVAGIAVLILAVNVAWYGLPFLRDSGAFRPLGAIVVVVIVSLVWAKARGR